MPLYLLPLFPLLGFVLLILGGRFFKGAAGGILGSVALVQRPVQQPDPAVEAEGVRSREAREVGA